MPDHIEDDYDCVFDDPIIADRRYRAERRDKVIACLGAIAEEATAALTAAGLSMPLFFSVPSGGEAVATFATPGDPSEEDWHRACEFRSIVITDSV